MGSPWSPPTWMKTNHRLRRREPEARVLRGLCAVLRQVHRGDAGRGDPDRRHHRPERAPAPGEQPEPSDAGPRAGRVHQGRTSAPRSAGPGSTPRSSSTTTTATGRIIRSRDPRRPRGTASMLTAPRSTSMPAKIEAMSAVHEAYPDKNLYFTEQWIGTPGTSGATSPGTPANLTSAPPATGAGRCSSGTWRPIRSSGPTRRAAARSAWGPHDRRQQGHAQPGLLHHCACLQVRPARVRADREQPRCPSCPNVAFRRPDGRKVLIVLNDGGVGADLRHQGRGPSGDLDPARRAPWEPTSGRDGPGAVRITESAPSSFTACRPSPGTCDRGRSSSRAWRRSGPLMPKTAIWYDLARLGVLQLDAVRGVEPGDDRPAGVARLGGSLPSTQTSP